jgi:uncharacterized repeat protein (TIGR03803 family)
MSKLNWITKACGFFLLWATAAVALHAQTFTSLYSFCPGGGLCTDGYYSEAAPVQATDGNLYGTTELGGTSANCESSGCGTIFKITPSGMFSTLFSFDLTDGGGGSLGPLVLGRDGDLYGTTGDGGAYCANDFGCGTVFKITLGGTLTTLVSFDYTNGYAPTGGLVLGSDGNFYGTTSGGGANDSCSNACGTVFKITPRGTLTTLYNFCSETNCTDGSLPFAGLIQAADGDFYGTTEHGGANDNCVSQTGCGTVFKITQGGTLTTLYNFCSHYRDRTCTDGKNPQGALVQAADGSFYGTTNGGATGTVFRITPGGKLTKLYTFCSQSNCADGYAPYAGLVFATDGNFYGTTAGGGSNGDGTVFEITPSGTLTTLHSFDGTDGVMPYAGLAQGTNGSFYGTTYVGGDNGGALTYGTIFSLSVGLGPFVQTVPTSGTWDEVISILGTDLTGATSVTFNGTAATFTVNSESEITTTVPTGATAGTVQVVTPTSGTLSSNVRFTVRP